MSENNDKSLKGRRLHKYQKAIYPVDSYGGVGPLPKAIITDFEAAEKKVLDITRAEMIAHRGMGKYNMELVSRLGECLGHDRLICLTPSQEKDIWLKEVWEKAWEKVNGHKTLPTVWDNELPRVDFETRGVITWDTKGRIIGVGMTAHDAAENLREAAIQLSRTTNFTLVEATERILMVEKARQSGNTMKNLQLSIRESIMNDIPMGYEHEGLKKDLIHNNPPYDRGNSSKSGFNKKAIAKRRKKKKRAKR